MSDQTAIEWTDATWNPIRGCARVSEGCRNCYAERVAARFSGVGQPYAGLAEMTSAGPRWTGKVSLVEEHLHDPLKWKRPRKIFVNSMSDLFHPDVPDGWINQIFAVMHCCPQHTFQILTKRPERMAEYCSRKSVYACALPPKRPNVWLGVSVEDQKTADERIPYLLQTPAAVRFLSCEPLLGPVDLRRACGIACANRGQCEIDKESGHRIIQDSESGGLWVECICSRLNGIHWVIVGGESGPKSSARPMHPDWARSIRDQCAAAGVPFFFKQWGEWVLNEPETGYERRCKKAAGRLLDGVEHNAFPEVRA